jgi:hypothetical protein
MNTIDATPLFLWRRITLFRARYLFLNFALRTNTHTADEIDAFQLTPSVIASARNSTHCGLRASGVDLTFATTWPRAHEAKVKSKTPLETDIC